MILITDQAIPCKNAKWNWFRGFGRIDEVGSNVTEFNKGDNIAYASSTWTYQQRVISADIAVKTPNGISHELNSLMTKD